MYKRCQVQTIHVPGTCMVCTWHLFIMAPLYQARIPFSLNVEMILSSASASGTRMV